MEFDFRYDRNHGHHYLEVNGMGSTPDAIKSGSLGEKELAFSSEVNDVIKMSHIYGNLGSVLDTLSSYIKRSHWPEDSIEIGITERQKRNVRALYSKYRYNKDFGIVWQEILRLEEYIYGENVTFPPASPRENRT